jgi:hypothetical protein
MNSGRSYAKHPKTEIAFQGCVVSSKPLLWKSIKFLFRSMIHVHTVVIHSDRSKHGLISEDLKNLITTVMECSKNNIIIESCKFSSQEQTKEDQWLYIFFSLKCLARATSAVFPCQKKAAQLA